jgi:hypothetical protein
MFRITSCPDGVPIPRWAVLAGSLFLVFHLGAVTTHVFSAPSGPWPGMEGNEPAPPPQFTALAAENVTMPYLSRLKMTHNYHFTSNRANIPAAVLDIRLLNDQGEVIKTIAFPDPQASSAVRRRQALAMRWFVEDRPIQPAQSEKIPAPGESIEVINTWRAVEGEQRKLRMTGVPVNEIDRGQPVFGPSKWSMVVARSFARYLCRVHGAESAEFVRKSREPVPPRILFEREVPPLMDVMESEYGRLTR